MATATNKRPTPAKSPTQLKAAPKPAAAASADLEDDDLDEDGGEKDRLSLAKRTAVRLGNSVNRIIKLAEKVGGWSADDAGHVVTAQGALTVAVEGLKAASEALVKLPDDYKSRVPKSKGGKGGSKVELLPGSIVRITDKAKAEYEGLDFQLTGIEVIEVRGNKVVCKTSDGMKAMIARGHVCPDVG